MISPDTPCTALAMFKEGEFVVHQKGYKDARGVENLWEETGKALLVWLSQMKTENGMISLSE